MITVLGIDPGSVITGFGLLRTDGVRSFHLDHGHWSLKRSDAEGPVDDFNLRLGRLHNHIVELLERHQPDEIAIEQVFLSKSVSSALKLGHARGAAIAAVVTRSLPVSEYTPRTIKQAVVGSGAASKEQVGRMMVQLLGLSELPQADAADALAVALCHCHSRGSFRNLANQAGSSSGYKPGKGARRRSVRWKNVPAKPKGIT